MGNYAPTLSDLATGMSNGTVYNTRYMQIGSMLQVFGTLDITKTGTSVGNLFNLSLPVPTSFASYRNALGSARQAAEGDRATITAVGGGNTVVFIAPASWNKPFSPLQLAFEFTYYVT